MNDSEANYTVVLVPSDTQRTRSLKITSRLLRIGGAIAALGAVGLALLLGSWWFFAAQTARVPGLEQQIAQLEADNARVIELGRTVDLLQTEYDKIRSMLGADMLASGAALGMLPGDESASEDDTAPSGLSPEIPTAWPLATGGFVTQVLEQAQDGTHPGIDIAVSQGSYIRASGAGIVLEAGADSVYGLYVLIEHGNSGYHSMYGHASRLFVSPGDEVLQNEVIALSGNTGRSTAPHLHFEILQDMMPIDPFTLVQQRTGS